MQWAIWHAFVKVGWYFDTLMIIVKNDFRRLYPYSTCSCCIYRELKMNLERSGVPVSVFLTQPSFHPCDASCKKDFARSIQCRHGMSFCKNCKELYGVDQRGSCPWHAYLTPDCVTGGAHAVPDSTVANCPQHNSITSIQNVMRSVSISLERRLLTCVDITWPGVIHVVTVGMVLLNARVIKTQDLTMMRVKAVMRMCFSQDPVMLAQIPPNHKTLSFV